MRKFYNQFRFCLFTILLMAPAVVEAAPKGGY